MLEEQGMTFHLANGTVAPLEDILISGGANSIRSRLWVNPVNGNIYTILRIKFKLPLSRRY